MDWNVLRWRRCLQRMPVALVPHRARVDLDWILITGCMLAGILLLLVVVGAMPSEEGGVTLTLDRQGILQAHPEWPPEVRAAVMVGIICIGMPPEMVWAAWGRPTRTSGRDGPDQPETWHYEGRLSAVERLGDHKPHDAGTREWTVTFINGRVVGWTD
jgi:hypothetical protein